MKNVFNAWISPTGRFINCDDVGHEDWAEEWFRQKYGDNAFNEKNRIAGHMEDYTNALHRLGWIRISGGYIVNIRGINVLSEALRMPKKQADTVQYWAMLNKNSSYVI